LLAIDEDCFAGTGTSGIDRLCRWRSVTLRFPHPSKLISPQWLVRQVSLNKLRPRRRAQHVPTDEGSYLQSTSLEREQRSAIAERRLELAERSR